MKKIYNIILITVLVVFFLISLTACSTTNPGQELFDRSKISISRDREVKAGDIIWKVENIEYIGPQIPNDNGDGFLESRFGRFIGVEFNVENTGQEIKTIIDLKVIDSRGKEFPICVEVYGYIGAGNACLLADIFPGTNQTFFASFDVPLDSVDLILEVSGLEIPPEEKAYIDLGI